MTFDEAHDDGSGDGPYQAATIDERRLQVIGEADLGFQRRRKSRRAVIDAALREVVEHPESGERLH